ncbi:MAG: MerR family transcriptional regulator [Proteobacteria bacterium]|nr:MerR family transcriptional regulator [Pseudomonadota bacterium]
MTEVAPLKRHKAPPPKMKEVVKRVDAYKTIAEVAAELGVATHVLRFWESKFPTLQPLKQSGGRRFYRPDDVKLLIYIKGLLYEQGYTIRGVQTALKQTKPKQLREVLQNMPMTPAQIGGALREIASLLRDVPPLNRG